MKKIITICAVLLMTASVFAQAPEKMSYQAVVRDGSNALVSSTAVGMQISILQGTSSGTAIYVETQTPTSNANGLVSLEIGSGTVVSGDFTTIDWANGPYFIKTETDPTGGTSYTITGTSQLLSVPYALHAKTAETVTGTITETDPVFGASVASGITGTDTTNWNNKQDQLVAGTNITIVGNTINATSGGSTLAIGDSYQGGIIFWLDATGQHGLIAATADQNTGIQWYNGTNRYTGTAGDGLYAGAMNTAMIVATQMADNQSGSFAAKVCADYSVTVGGVTYGDWYLPSKYELNLLYLQKIAVGGFASAYYWSSTEYDNNYAWSQAFNSGFQDGYNKFATFRVRAVRAF
ncbi:MAG: DUF1566 domain-containing protein [Bacteroidetes bacterium]|nr:DUF1566 domain-containing protein [Bacteroidota bacterium]